MIKSLLYYIALLLFVIYNCNTPLNSIKSFIPVSIGKYLLSFPVFIIVTTILVVYPILTGKELFTFDTNYTMENIFRPDDPGVSVNRATVVIDDSGEIILEKSSDVNKNFSDLITSIRIDLANLNSKVNNNSNVLKNQLETLVTNTKSNIDSLNTHFAKSASAESAITPARVAESEISCKQYKVGNNWVGGPNGNNTSGWTCPRAPPGVGHAHLDQGATGGVTCTDGGDVAWLTSDRHDWTKGKFACIRKNGLKFESADTVGAKQGLPSLTTDFTSLQTS